MRASSSIRDLTCTHSTSALSVGVSGGLSMLLSSSSMLSSSAMRRKSPQARALLMSASTSILRICASSGVMSLRPRTSTTVSSSVCRDPHRSNCWPARACAMSASSSLRCCLSCATGATAPAPSCSLASRRLACACSTPHCLNSLFAIACASCRLVSCSSAESSSGVGNCALRQCRPSMCSSSRPIMPESPLSSASIIANPASTTCNSICARLTGCTSGRGSFSFAAPMSSTAASSSAQRPKSCAARASRISACACRRQ
mmetsp:Transcript_2636/g.5796  ORF Transcript_2636/g.5796 Transcript_2636/m.5796 type:complete len:259 (+) Transcript_2636:612-1388(+)